MNGIVLTRAWDLAATLSAVPITWAISIGDIEDLPPDLEFLPPRRRIRLAFHDIAEPRPGRNAPERHHAEAILDLVDRWNGQGVLLIHCFAGTSRSAAAVLVALARLYPGREQDSVEMVQTKAPHIMPNRRMIVLADEILGADRRLIDAVACIPLPTERVFKGFILVPLPLRCD